jgi:ubiquinol-cytochrome c reductase core subunit 2
MISRASVCRPAHLTLSRQCLVQQSTRRGLAAPASGTFAYETSDAAGVKIASRDLPGPMTTVSVVAKAGTRYQTLPGFADGLEQFTFKVRHNGPSCKTKRPVVLQLTLWELSSPHTDDQP